jgi:hypothetical protein
LAALSAELEQVLLRLLGSLGTPEGEQQVIADQLERYLKRIWLWVPVMLAALAQPVLAQSAIERALAATVTIEVVSSDGPGHGSGFVISSDGMIVTAAHVMEGATSAMVRFHNGEELNVEGIITADPIKDFAIIRVAGFDLPTVPLGNADDLTVGERVIVIGAPLDPTLAGTVSDGLVAAERVVDGTKILQISAPTSPGNSGGPVMTEQGQVIGLVVSGITAEGAQNLNFALPINYVRGQLSLAETRPLQPLAELSVTPNADNAPVSTFGNATPSNEIEELVLSYLEDSYQGIKEMLEEEGGEVDPSFHSFLGSLSASEREAVSLALPETENLLFLGVCDDDCSDLDLALRDASDNLLDEDIDPDSYPIVVLEQVSQAPGNVTVEVSMATCTVEPCYYAVGVFRVEQPSGPLPAPTPTEPLEATVVVTMEMDVANPDGPGMVTHPLSDIEVQLLPFDRDAVFDSMEAAFGMQEPIIPASLIADRERLREVQIEWQEHQERWTSIRERLTGLSERMEGLNRGETLYVTLYRQWIALEEELGTVELQMNASFDNFSILQELTIEASDSIRALRERWGDRAFEGVGEVFFAKLQASELDMVTDTTDASGVARENLTVKPGRYWIYARYELTYSELYWNFPIDVEAGEPIVIALTRANAEESIKL